MLGREASSSSLFSSGDEEKVLKGMLDAFGSAFSLDEIASAYCKAGRNADLASEILYKRQENNSSSNASNGDVCVEKPLEQSRGNQSEDSCQANGMSKDSKHWRPKSRPVSVGIVSNVIGKEYAMSKPSENGSSYGSKPLNLNSKILPIWGEEADSRNSAKNYPVHRDMEDFLFRMLGNGFKLERDVIQEVLGSCGYDMQKSMEKLLDLSAPALDERKTSSGQSIDKCRPLCPRSELASSQINVQENHRLKGASRTSNLELTGPEKARHDLQKEILVSLFNSSDRPEELPRRITSTKRSQTYGQVVTEPLRDTDTEQKKISTYTQQHDVDVEDEENSYQLLRKAFREFLGMMKEYYKAAIDAFAEDDLVRAGKLLEQGKFYQQKAREADEESCQIIVETRIPEKDEMLLDLHDHDAKEAACLLKSHLSSLCGISSMKYLKVIIDTNDEVTSKGSRRRRRIMRLLEKDSFKWTEEGSVGTILIQLDSIKRRR